MPANSAAIHTIRLLVGISQAELGRRIGKPHHYLSNIEAGRRGASRPMAERIAEALSIPVEAIWHEDRRRG